MSGDDIMEFPKASEDVKALVRKMEVVITFGENEVKGNEEVRRKRTSQNGCMKASPMKIIRCLKRMEEVANTQKQLSQRSIAKLVAEKYATIPRNCFR